MHDVLQHVTTRLHQNLADVQPKSARELFGLTRLQFTKEPTDLARKHYGPRASARTMRQTTGRLARQTHLTEQSTPRPTIQSGLPSGWSFTKAIEGLEEPGHEVFQMSWYKLMSHAEMGTALGVSTKTIQRRFRDACVERTSIVA